MPNRRSKDNVSLIVVCTNMDVTWYQGADNRLADCKLSSSKLDLQGFSFCLVAADRQGLTVLKIHPHCPAPDETPISALSRLFDHSPIKGICELNAGKMVRSILEVGIRALQIPISLSEKNIDFSKQKTIYHFYPLNWSGKESCLPSACSQKVPLKKAVTIIYTAETSTSPLITRQNARGKSLGIFLPPRCNREFMRHPSRPCSHSCPESWFQHQAYWSCSWHPRP